MWRHTPQAAAPRASCGRRDRRAAAGPRRVLLPARRGPRRRRAPLARARGRGADGRRLLLRQRRAAGGRRAASRWRATRCSAATASTCGSPRRCAMPATCSAHFDCGIDMALARRARGRRQQRARSSSTTRGTPAAPVHRAAPRRRQRRARRVRGAQPVRLRARRLRRRGARRACAAARPRRRGRSGAGDRGAAAVSVLVGLDVGTSGVKGLALDPAGNGAGPGRGELSAQHAAAGLGRAGPGGLVAAASSRCSARWSRTTGVPAGHRAQRADARPRGARRRRRASCARRSCGTTSAPRRSAPRSSGASAATALVALTGNRALTGFTAPKLLWLADHEPDVHARIASVMLPKDYVRFRLCGERATDVADASGTLLARRRRAGVERARARGARRRSGVATPAAGVAAR